MNPKTGFYEFKFNQGIVETCEVEEGWQVGAFFKNNFIFHKADFSVSGEVNNSVPVEPRELGKFNEANGNFLSFGGSISHRLWNRFYGTGKIRIENSQAS